jgi:hypothetical protein
MGAPPPDAASSLEDRCRAALARRVGIDTRTLAAFRVALAVTLLVDLLHRSTDLVAFYTDRGILPRSALAEQSSLAATVSVHALSGAAWFQAALFVLAGAVALALLVGVRSRLAAAVSLYLLVSLQARNPLVLNSGDLVLVMLLGLGVLVPLGERWSIDALGRAARRRHVATIGSATILLQMVAVCATNAVFKSRSDTWRQGEAFQQTLRLDQFTILLGDHLAGHPTLARMAAYCWLALLAGSPLLILLTGRARTALVALFAGTHLGMALTMDVGLFPLVLTTGVLLFLPAGAWDALERRAEPRLDGVPLDRWAAALTGGAQAPPSRRCRPSSGDGVAVSGRRWPPSSSSACWRGTSDRSATRNRCPPSRVPRRTTSTGGCSRGRPAPTGGTTSRPNSTPGGRSTLSTDR